MVGSGSRPQAAPAALLKVLACSYPAPRLFFFFMTLCGEISSCLVLGSLLFLSLCRPPPAKPHPVLPSPLSPEWPPRPCIQGLQLADEFIRPKALPRSMTAFRPNQEDIGVGLGGGYGWWSLGTKHGHWRRDRKVPRCPSMSVRSRSAPTSRSAILHISNLVPGLQSPPELERASGEARGVCGFKGSAQTMRQTDF